MSEVLKVERVTKSYGAKKALNGVSFTLKGGETAGLLGPNGSGKTTLIKIINTLITDYSGKISVCGEHLGVSSKGAIAYLPDCDYLSAELKISAAVGLYRDFYSDFDYAKFKEMLAKVSLEEKMRIKTLSKGMKEKLQLVLTMSRAAKLYIFDEPIAGVDPASRDFILDTILKNYNDGGAIILSTHLIADVEPVLNRVLFIKNGAIIADDTKEGLREKRGGLTVDQIFREDFKI